MKLPKPHSVMVTNADVGCVELLDCYTADQMRQMRIDALEEAAKMCLSMLYCDFKGNPLQYGPVIEVNEVIRDCAAAIQSLKEKKHE